MARGRESFFEGILRGYQTHEAMLRQKKLDELAAEDRQLTRKGIQLQQTALESQEADRERVRAAQEAVSKAGKIGIETQFVPGKTEGEMDQVFTVNGQQFKNRAAAEAALEGLNSPLAVAKRQYQAALDTGVGELADRYSRIYKEARDTTEQDFRQGFTTAMRTGGLQGVLDFYNKNVKDGRTLVAQRGPGGKVTVGEYVGGKLQGDPATYNSEKDFIAEQVQRFSASPESYLEAFYRDRQFGEGVRQFNEGMGLKRDELAAQKEYQQGQLGIGRMNASANQMQAGTAAAVAARPTVVQTVTPDGTGTNLGVVRFAPGSNKPEYSQVGVQAGVRTPPKPVDPLSQMIADKARGKMGGMGTGTAGIEINEEGLLRLDELMKGR